LDLTDAPLVTAEGVSVPEIDMAFRPWWSRGRTVARVDSRRGQERCQVSIWLLNSKNVPRHGEARLAWERAVGLVRGISWRGRN